MKFCHCGSAENMYHYLLDSNSRHYRNLWIFLSLFVSILNFFTILECCQLQSISKINFWHNSNNSMQRSVDKIFLSKTNKSIKNYGFRCFRIFFISMRQKIQKQYSFSIPKLGKKIIWVEIVYLNYPGWWRYSTDYYFVFSTVTPKFLYSFF